MQTFITRWTPNINLNTGSFTTVYSNSNPWVFLSDVLFVLSKNTVILRVKVGTDTIISENLANLVMDFSLAAATGLSIKEYTNKKWQFSPKPLLLSRGGLIIEMKSTQGTTTVQHGLTIGYTKI